jgi:phage tail-like protein
MAPGGRQDPYRQFRFRVEIDGITQAGFHEVIFGDTSSDVVEYREGNELPHVRKESGPVRFGNLVLKWGITDSMEMYNWRKLVEDSGAEAAKKNMSVILVDSKGMDKARWDIADAWPVRYGLWNDFDAKGHSVLLEWLEITCEGFRRVT